MKHTQLHVNQYYFLTLKDTCRKQKLATFPLNGIGIYEGISFILCPRFWRIIVWFGLLENLILPRAKNEKKEEEEESMKRKASQRRDSWSGGTHPQALQVVGPMWSVQCSILNQCPLGRPCRAQIQESLWLSAVTVLPQRYLPVLPSQADREGTAQQSTLAGGWVSSQV